MSKRIRNSKIENAIINILKKTGVEVTDVELYADGKFNIKYVCHMEFMEEWAEPMTSDDADILIKQCGIDVNPIRDGIRRGHILYKFSCTYEAFEEAQSFGYFYGIDLDDVSLDPELRGNDGAYIQHALTELLKTDVYYNHLHSNDFVPGYAELEIKTE